MQQHSFMQWTSPSDYVKQKYNLKKKLGQGTFGSVYLATEKNGTEEFAVKVCIRSREQYEDEAEYKNCIEDLRKEKEAIDQCNHKNIVKHFNSELRKNNDSSVLIFCMEKCDGTLYDLLKQRKSESQVKNKQPFTEVEIADFIKQLLDALIYLSQLPKRIIHLDITTENILIKKTNNGIDLKLSDFGICKFIKQRNNQYWNPHTTLVHNTCASPEVRRAQPINESTDIFSVGLIICRMCLPDNHQLFQDLSNNNTYKYNIPNLGKDYQFLQGLIENMLKHDPKDRSSAESLLKKINDFLYNKQFQNISANIYALLKQKPQDFSQYTCLISDIYNQLVDYLDKNQNSNLSNITREQAINFLKLKTIRSVKQIDTLSALGQAVEMLIFKIELSEELNLSQIKHNTLAMLFTGIYNRILCLRFNKKIVLIRENKRKKDKLEYQKMYLDIQTPLQIENYNNENKVFDLVIQDKAESREFAEMLPLRYLNYICKQFQEITLSVPDILLSLTISNLKISNLNECVNLINICSQECVYQKQDIMFLKTLRRFSSQNDTYKNNKKQKCMIERLFKKNRLTYVYVRQGDNIVKEMILQYKYIIDLRVFYIKCQEIKIQLEDYTKLKNLQVCCVNNKDFLKDNTS